MASLKSDTTYPAYTYPVPENKTLTSRSLSSLSSLSWSEWKEVIYKTLDEYEMRLNQNKHVSSFKRQYFGNKYPITYILFGMLLSSVILTLYMLSGIRALSNIVGVVVPFYMSLKALNINGNGNGNEMNKNENTLWLSYWIIYGMFTLFESLSHILLFWMGNMYEICKMAFFLYLYHPNTKGALFLYRQCLQPFVVQFINYEHALLRNIHILQKNVSINEDDIILNHDNTNTNANNINTNNINTNTNNNNNFNNNNFNNNNFNNNINNNNNNNINNYRHNDIHNINKNYTMNTNTSANTSKMNNYMPSNTATTSTTTVLPPSLPIITSTATVPISQTQPIITSTPFPNINNAYVQ